MWQQGIKSLWKLFETAQRLRVEGYELDEAAHIHELTDMSEDLTVEEMTEDKDLGNT